MQKLTLHKRVMIGMILTVLLVGGAFICEQMAKTTGSQNGKLLPVVQNNKIVAYIDAGTIQQLNIQERTLKKNGSKGIADNQASLDFVLGSAGIIKYHSVQVYDVGDEGGKSLSSPEAGGMALAANQDGTISMLTKAEGDRVVIKHVRKLLVED